MTLFTIHSLPKAPQFYKDQDTAASPPARSTLAQPGCPLPTSCPGQTLFSIPSPLPLRTSASHNGLFLPETHLSNWTGGRWLFPNGTSKTTSPREGEGFRTGRRWAQTPVKTYFPAKIWSSVTEPCLTSRGNTLHCNLSCMNYTYGCQ